MLRGLFYSILGVGFGVAGYDKAFGTAYKRLFRHWGFSRQDMKLVGVGELAGGALMVLPSTRKLGAAVLTGTSAVVLKAETEHNDGKLALARVTLMVLAASALLGRSRRR